MKRNFALSLTSLSVALLLGGCGTSALDPLGKHIKSVEDPICDPYWSFASGPGMSAGPTNNESTFTFFCLDSNGEPLTSSPGEVAFDITLTGPDSEEYKGAWEDYMDGSFGMWYVAPRIGTYWLTVKIGDVQVGSAQEITIDGPVPANCRATGSGISNGTAYVGKLVQLHSKNGNGTPITYGNDPFRVRAFRGNQEYTSGAFYDNLDGSYNYIYTPDEPGSWTIEATLAGEHIDGSPFHVVFTP